MRNIFKVSIAVGLALMLVFSGVQLGDMPDESTVEAAEVEIDFWYALGGDLRARTEELIDSFMEEHPDVYVDKVHRGSYAEALTTAIASYRGGSPPYLTQVYEVGTMTMLDSGAIKPVYELIDIDPEEFIGPVTEYYSVDGNLYSLPFNSSNPIMYYNKDMFEEAGLDPEDSPETFAEVEEYSRQIIENTDAEAGFSTAWPSWILMENMHTWHDQPIADQANGMEGYATELYWNEDFGVELLEKLGEWNEEDIYTYEGREGDPDPVFLGEDVGMYMQSTATLAGFMEDADFEVGTAKLPHMGGEYEVGNALLGGGTIWAFDGHTEAEVEAMSDMLTFISQPENQAWWHRNTGYLPVTHEAIEELEEEGWFEENPNYETAIEQSTVYDDFSGLRLGNYTEIRDINLEELENFFAGDQTAQETADNMVRRGNRVLERYRRTQQ